MYESITREELLRPGETIVLGVSGGVDSMVLLEMLRRMNKWELHLAHFNHCLRGAESDADEAFVQSTAERLGWPFSSARDDVKAYSEKIQALSEVYGQFPYESRTGRSN